MVYKPTVRGRDGKDITALSKKRAAQRKDSKKKTKPSLKDKAALLLQRAKDKAKYTTGKLVAAADDARATAVRVVTAPAKAISAAVDTAQQIVNDRAEDKTKRRITTTLLLAAIGFGVILLGRRRK